MITVAKVRWLYYTGVAMRLKGIDKAATKVLRLVFPVKCYILRYNLQSVSDNHAEFEYVFFEVLLVYGIVLEYGTIVIYSLWRIRQDANYKTNPQAYVITKKTVTSKSVLKLNSVAGGGFAISILAQ